MFKARRRHRYAVVTDRECDNAILSNYEMQRLSSTTFVNDSPIVMTKFLGSIKKIHRNLSAREYIPQILPTMRQNHGGYLSTHISESHRKVRIEASKWRPLSRFPLEFRLFFSFTLVYKTGSTNYQGRF
jgi:hypothetical protein